MYLQRPAFCSDFVKVTDTDDYIFYHFSLKGHSKRRYAVWANGILSESIFKKDVLTKKW